MNAINNSTVVPAAFHMIENVLEVCVLDRNGYETGEERTISNTVWAEFYSDKNLVMINWLRNNGVDEEPKEEHLVAPIVCKATSSKWKHLNGKTFHGGWAWGSAVKKGYTIGLEEDIMQNTGMAVKSEDGQRAGRALTPNALYGAGRGILRIYVARVGELIAGRHPAADGFGYGTQSAVNIMRNKRTGIQLGEVRDNFHMTQRVVWSDALKAETMPFISDRLVELADPLALLHINRMKQNEKQEMVNLDPQMIKHPFVANYINRSSQETASRTATSIPMHGAYRVAVPSIVAYDEKTRMGGVASLIAMILGRYPMDSYDSETAIMPMESDAVTVKNEIARISSMAVAQYTLYSTRFFAKGQFGVVPDADLFINGVQYDLVICEEDIKMCSDKGGVATLRGRTQIVDDCYLGMTMFYEAGYSIGINYELWAAMGGDYDGDGAVVVDCAMRPVLWAACREFPRQKTLKLLKTNTTFEKMGDMRVSMILKSRICSKVVGLATNLMASTFAVKNRAMLANSMGYTLGIPDADTDLDKKLNFWIKVGTDGFKTDVNVASIYILLNTTSEVVRKELGKAAPWCGWHQDAMAFRHTVPVFMYEGMSKEEKRTGIPLSMDGTVVDVLRITLPEMAKFLTNGVDAYPLSHFRYWSASAADDIMVDSDALNVKFGTRSTNTNWSDDSSVDQFKVWYDAEIKAYDDKWQVYTRMERASALWRSAHNTKSAHSGAGAIFQATLYRDELHQIITDKPGKHGVTIEVVTLLGLYHALPEVMWGDIGGDPAITCDLVIGEYIEKDKKDPKRSTIRKIAQAAIPGMIAATDGHPVDTLGTIAASSAQPANGEYEARITRTSDKGWQCELIRK